MRIIRDYSNCPQEAKNSVVTLGNFDGIHKGHGYILDQVKNFSTQQNLPSGIITFEPHPLKILKQDKTPSRITPFVHKAELLKAYGIDNLFCIKFSEVFSKMTAENFVKDILVGALSVRHVVIGHDFIFGHNREGNPEYLRKMAAQYNFGFTEIAQVEDNGTRFSSTRIREAVRKGDMETAEKLLGRPFSIRGKVISGEKRGAKLGFATANLALKEYIRPAYGVYTCVTVLDGKDYPGVANIGINPTFSIKKEVLEAHIFNFNQDIYGKKIEVQLKHFLRPEQKFKDVEELKIQINKDVRKAKEIS